MSDDNNELSGLFAALTETQRQAALWQDGALLLLAGPGSGKTRVLTARIARIISESPKNRWRVLALTFTNRAADEMRERILKLVPDSDDRLFVGTFHSFACEVLRQSGSLIGIRTDFRIYSAAADRLLLLQECIRELGLPVSAEKMLPILDRLRDRLVAPEESTRFFADAEMGQLVATIYQAYVGFLSKENAIDFPAIIYNAHRLLTEFPAIAKRYSTTYKFICLDEFQDTNDSQYSLLQSLVGEEYKNVFCVADDDQIIYQWNGASHKRISEFEKNYSPALIQMPTNFRCPSAVVALANNLVAHNKLRSEGKRPLEAAKLGEVDSAPVRTMRFDTDTDEADGVARDIADLHKLHPGKVAVIARTKALLDGVQKSLRLHGIEAQIAQRRDTFGSLPYAWLHSVLSVANRRSDERLFQTFGDASNKLFGFDLDLSSVVTAAAASNGDLLRAWFNAAPRHSDSLAADVLQYMGSDLAERVDYRRFIRSTTSQFTAKKKLYEAEFPVFDEDHRAWAELNREIMSSLGPAAGLEAFLQELEMRSKEPPLTAEVLPLLTIHGSKGNEFDHVYIIGLAEDILPSFQSKQKGDLSPEMEEERRNCFVAITRCMRTLVLSHAATYRNWKKPPSRFLTEMAISDVD